MGIIDTKKSILNPIIKKLKVDQNELVAIGFCAALGNILYGVIRRVSTALSWYPFPSLHSSPLRSHQITHRKTNRNDWVIHPFATSDWQFH